MADTFGAVSKTIAAGSTPGSDPALGYLGAYLQETLNAYAQAAWSEVAPGQPVVRTVLPHDPERHDFNEKDCPALFLWREDSPVERIADDILASQDTVNILWIFEPATQHKQRDRKPFLVAFKTIVAQVLEQGRDPAWVVQGDTDANAATRGSLIQLWAGLSRIFPPTFKTAGLQIETYDGSGKTLPYDGVLCELKIEELRERDPAAYTGGAPSALTLNTQTTTDQDTTLDLVEYQDPLE